MDAPLQRTLKVGKTTIGLVGLDIALNRIQGNNSMPLAEAVEQVYAEIAEKNYIPASSAHLYMEAIQNEIERLQSGRETEAGELTIRILGPGCVACNNLQKVVIEIMSDMGVAADIFQIHDLDEIGRFGITQTPALIINGKVKSAGIQPSRSLIEQWLREAING